MKLGYATLLSLVVAYSAYQGTSTLKNSVSQSETRSSGESAKKIPVTPRGSSKPSVSPFPTIANGLCELKITAGHDAPCGDCKALCPAKDLRGLIGDYFKAESTKDEDFLNTHWNVPHTEQAKIQFVIASLPDPVHTHMALLFDRGVETIQSAAQASGYLFSRAWMPWDISTHSESTDFTVRLAQDTYRDQAELLPGLMIFQKTDENGTETNILFVFVVGETPTGGLHVEQFQNALNIRKAILNDADPAAPGARLESKTLRIDGPAFSGSLHSLDTLLKSQPVDDFSRIVIRSGTVSSFHAVHDFCESTFEEAKKTPHGAWPDFASFEFSDSYQEFYLGNFLKRDLRNHSHSHVAILSEDETAFGNQDASSATKDTGNNCPLEPPRDTSFVRLYFPREIAQLRDAYQRDAKTQSTAANSKTPPQTGLTLSLSVTGNDDDTVAAYSPLQTPLSQESILQAIVSSLRQEHARVVIVRGSDPLDVLFLCRYLRQNFPQGRIVTVGADLLMIHDFYDPRFHGILALTSYPLLTGVEFPTRNDPNALSKQHIHRLFPDSYSVGDFNAFQSLLAKPESETPQTLPSADYAQIGLPSFLQPVLPDGKSKTLRAYLWLTTIGRDGYWPVDVLDDVPPVNPPNTDHPEPSVLSVNPNAPYNLKPYSVHFKISWTIFWMFISSLTIFLAYLIAFPTDANRSETLARFSGGVSAERHGLLFAGCMLLLACETIFVFPSIVWLQRFGAADEGIASLFNGLWLVMISYIFCVGLLGVACYAGFRDRGHPKFAKWGAGVCGGALLLVLLSVSYMGSLELPDRFGAFVYRYLNIGSGVSPALPLLFLVIAWLWWCWQTLTGVASTEEKHMVLPRASEFKEVRDPEEYCDAKKGLTKAGDRVRLRALAARDKEWPWRTLGALPLEKFILWPTFIGIGLMLLLMWPSEIAEAFEFRGYKFLYWILLYSCLLLVCFLIVQIIALWLEFRTLLRAIEKVPFRRGFGDLKSLTWKPLWKLAGNGRQEFVQLLGGEVKILSQIQSSVKSYSCLDKAIDRATTATDVVSAEFEKWSPHDKNSAQNVRDKFYALQDALGVAATEALIFANEQWENESKTYTPPNAKKSSEDDSKDKDAGNSAPAEPPAKDPTLRGVEQFLCLFYLNIILVPLRRLQTLILAMAGVFVFVLISYSSYPFESRESFHVLLISIFFVISLVVGIVYGQMYTNPLLSRITNTKPGELGLDFWVRLGTFVFVPLLSLLSVQFPEINNFLFSWLQPALQSIK